MAAQAGLGRGLALLEGRSWSRQAAGPPQSSAALGGEKVAMQMRRRRAGTAPLPRGPLVAKTDHSPEQSPRNGRCPSSLSSGETASLPGGAGSGCSDLLSTPSPPNQYLREGSCGLGLSLEQGRALIGLEPSRNTSAALPWRKGVGLGGRLQTVFVMTGLSLSLPVAMP